MSTSTSGRENGICFLVNVNCYVLKRLVVSAGSIEYVNGFNLLNRVRF